MVEYLYHYTTVDTLELILKNKTIRFNPLTKMDDNLEQWSAHGKQEGSHRDFRLLHHKQGKGRRMDRA